MKKVYLIPKILIIVCIIIGIGLFVQGAKETIELNQRIEGFEETIGVFVGTELYSEADYTGKVKHNATYSLIYEYYVSNEIYTVKTDYGSGAIPERGYQETILYNPDNPSDAVIEGVNGPSIMLFLGAFFVLIPMVFITATLVMNGTFGNRGYNIMDIVIGLVFTSFSIGMIYMIAGSFSLVTLFMMAGPFALIPILMTIAGLVVLVRGFVGKK